MTMLRVIAVAFAVTLLAGLTTPIFAQAPPPPPLETYAFSHIFALPTATTTRLSGMGGFITCIKDDGFANPAFAGTLTETTALGRISCTDTDAGLDLTGTQVSVASPFKSGNEGWQVTHFGLSSNRAVLTINGQPAGVEVQEDDWSVHYGRTVDEDWVLGAAVSPKFETDTTLRHPVSDARLAHIHSDSDFGFRIGALYRLDGGGFAGMLYDRYDEDVTGSGMLYGGEVTGDFTSEELAIGISRPLTERILGAVEWQQLQTDGDGVEVGDSGIRFGVEGLVAESWTVRAGSNDGALSLGLGFENDRWALRYAYVDDWNDDTASQYVGGSDTHQVEISGSW